MLSTKQTRTALLGVTVVFLLAAGRAPAQGRWVRQYAVWRAAPAAGWPVVAGGLYPADPLAGNGQVVGGVTFVGAAPSGGGPFPTGVFILGGSRENPLEAALREQRQNGLLSVLRQHQYNPAPAVLPPQPLYDARLLWQQQQNPPPRPPAAGK